jgi:hypothetical protein
LLVAAAVAAATTTTFATSCAARLNYLHKSGKERRPVSRKQATSAVSKIARAQHKKASSERLVIYCGRISLICLSALAGFPCLPLPVPYTSISKGEKIRIICERGELTLCAKEGSRERRDFLGLPRRFFAKLSE